MGNADVDRVLTQLLQGNLAPPSVEGIDLITTHISWVVRTQREVFKLKRPVRYAFVDFATKELRHRACLEEVRLNRRLAPDVYLGVVPVFSVNGVTRVIDSSEAPAACEAVDHVVRMRRLADDDACHRRLSQARLQPFHLEALAQRLAGFYSAVPDQPFRDIGSAGAWLSNIDELHAANMGAGNILEPDEVGFVRAQMEQQLQRFAELLQQRALAARDGHGDLRLEHVYFEGDSQHPLVIDSVEFEPAFRWGDWALDVAFLAMELQAEGRDDLAAWLWSCISREMFDHAFFPLIDVYVMHRALVRAKIALLVAAGAPEADKRGRKRQEAQRLWQVAMAAAQGRHAGTAAVVCVGGVVGSGKSVVANALVLACKGPCLSSDYTRKALAGLPATHPAQPQHYGEAFNAATLQSLLHHAQPVLDSGRPVIFDATFRTRAWRQAARDLAAAKRVPFLFVQTTCSEDTLRARLQAREGKRGVSDAREGLLTRIQSEFEPPTETPASQRLLIDTEAPLADAISLISQRLQS